MDRTQEVTHFWRIPRYNRLELLRATYITQNFSKHSHDEYAIGVIERGAHTYYYRGATYTSWAGSIITCNPGEIHTGQAAAEGGWTYRMFYIDPVLVQQIAGEMQTRGLPFFGETIIQDDQTANLLYRLHLTLEKSDSLLEQDTRWWEALSQFIARHADDPPVSRVIGQEKSPIEKARAYMEAHYRENIGLHELAEVAHLSRFHFLRSFRAVVGMTPYAYLVTVRVRQARKLLAQGIPIALVAAETGFTDQSHLHHWFRRIYGITPGQYRNILQDTPRYFPLS